MEDLLQKILPGLNLIRDVLMKVAEYASKLIDVAPENMYAFILILISLYTSKKLMDFFYVGTEGRWGYFFVIAGILFWVLRYLGVN